MKKKKPTGTDLALGLANRLLETCALFCDSHDIGGRGIDERQVCLVALQSALMAHVAAHPNAVAVRIKLVESLMDGTTNQYIQTVVDSNNKGGFH